MPFACNQQSSVVLNKHKSTTSDHRKPHKKWFGWDLGQIRDGHMTKIRQQKPLSYHFLFLPSFCPHPQGTTLHPSANTTPPQIKRKVTAQDGKASKSLNTGKAPGAPWSALLALLPAPSWARAAAQGLLLGSAQTQWQQPCPAEPGQCLASAQGLPLVQTDKIEKKTNIL